LPDADVGVELAGATGSGRSVWRCLARPRSDSTGAKTRNLRSKAPGTQVEPGSPAVGRS